MTAIDAIDRAIQIAVAVGPSPTSRCSRPLKPWFVAKDGAPIRSEDISVVVQYSTEALGSTAKPIPVLAAKPAVIAAAPRKSRRAR